MDMLELIAKAEAAEAPKAKPKETMQAYLERQRARSGFDFNAYQAQQAAQGATASHKQVEPYKAPAKKSRKKLREVFKPKAKETPKATPPALAPQAATPKPKKKLIPKGSVKRALSNKAVRRTAMAGGAALAAGAAWKAGKVVPGLRPAVIGTAGAGIAGAAALPKVRQLLDKWRNLSDAKKTAIKAGIGLTGAAAAVPGAVKAYHAVRDAMAGGGGSSGGAGGAGGRGRRGGGDGGRSGGHGANGGTFSRGRAGRGEGKRHLGSFSAYLPGGTRTAAQQAQLDRGINTAAIAGGSAAGGAYLERVRADRKAGVD